MATQTQSGKIVTIKGMSVAGGELKLPKDHKYYVNITLDYNEVAVEEIINLASGGSSVRVQAQAKLRADEPTLKASGIIADSYSEEVQRKIDALEKTINFNVATDFESEKGGKRDPQKTAISAFGKMDAEQKYQYLTETMGLDMVIALVTVQKHHPDFTIE